MSEKRARNVRFRDRVREIGSLDESFHRVAQIIHARGDRVQIIVRTAPGQYERLPVMDGDEVVEVEDE